MTRTDKRIVEITLETLNDLVDEGRSEALLKTEGFLETQNRLLSALTDGQELAISMDTDGRLNGFVLKRQKKAPKPYVQEDNTNIGAAEELPG